ncbi:flavin reductase family protein [Catenulispora pinisilvae]|uniref:flavin reductase family protein n=1 Tax=Catenulispora pinisilvae TaxID=2705253 RepID=UPI002B2701F2|nr:flavin reductase family protein [Catenulispora pinisilvae]
MSTSVDSGLSAVDPVVFREAMSRLAAPLAIITTRGPDGRPWGFTASSVASMSLDPPLVVVGVAHTSSCYDALAKAEGFAVNLLGDQHRALARRFAEHGADRFAGREFEACPVTELPCLSDANAVFKCRTAERITIGDHDLLVGELIAVRLDSVTRPLLWYRRDFHVPG